MASLQEAIPVAAPGVLTDDRKGFGLRGEQATSEGPGAGSRALPGAPLKLLLLETPQGGKVNAAAGKGAVAPLVHRWFRYASQVTYCPAGCIPGKKPLLHRFAMGLTASL